MASQQEVIKAFMASLDKTTLKGSEALDEAIRACSDFKSMSEVIAQMLEDQENSKDGDTFLKTYCGIILDNDDTGAITGADAGGSEIKSKESVIPESKSLIKTTDNSFTRNGLTFTLAKDFNSLSAKEQFVWQSMYTWWAQNALDLIEESYGLNFKNADTVNFNEVTVSFAYNPNTSWRAWNSWHANWEGNVESVELVINMIYYPNLDETNPNGYSSGEALYLDKTIAHELTHSIMHAKIWSSYALPSFISEGMSELTIGIDDERSGYITTLAENSTLLQNNLNGTSNDYAYAAGYMFLRYLAKQASTPEAVGINITNGNSNSVISGTAYADTVNNYGAKSTINVGGDDDMVRNYSVASGTAINAGAGDDYLLNFADSVTINAGDGNDTINNSNSGYLDGGNFSSGDVANRVFISGGNGEDNIENSGSNVTISGGADDDTIKNYGSSVLFLYNSGDGSDIIYGFNANDTISLSSGLQYKRSTNSSDVFINFANGAITLDGASGKTINIVGGIQSVTTESAKNISNSSSNSVVNGTAYADTINNYGENVTINANGGNDYIYNQNGKNAIINCGSGNDTINNNTYSDDVLIDGGAGDDYFIYNWGRNATLLGGEGNDTVTNYKNAYNNGILVYSLGGANSKMDGGTGNDFLENNAEYVSISGGSGADTIRTWGIKGTINGGVGNDVISLESDSSLNLIKYSNGDGSDIIYGFNENSTLSIAGSTYTSTKSGSDLIFTVGNGKITLRGAANLSKVNIQGTKKSSTSTTLTVTNSTKSPVTVGSSIKTINASSRTTAVKITGNKLDNTIKGGSNKDTIQGGAGKDSILGNAGNDKLYGNAGNDTLFGGAGNDTLWGGDDNDQLYGNAGNDSILGGDGNDSIKGQAGADKLYGNAGNDSILGGDGNDLIKGQTGDDKLYGNAGNDSLMGGDGKDSLWGGKGNDMLWGGAGADMFTYLANNGTDYIMDYASGELLRIYNEAGTKRTSFSKSVFSNDTLTLTINGGGTIIFDDVGRSTKFNINGTSYKVSGSKLVKS